MTDRTKEQKIKAKRAKKQEMSKKVNELNKKMNHGKTLF